MRQSVWRHSRLGCLEVGLLRACCSWVSAGIAPVAARLPAPPPVPVDRRCDADQKVRVLGVAVMKVTVELSDSEMAEILNLTGERKKGPAIRRLMEEALQVRRRAEVAQRFLSGEWGVELETYEADQAHERRRAQQTSA